MTTKAKSPKAKAPKLKLVTGEETPTPTPEVKAPAETKPAKPAKAAKAPKAPKPAKAEKPKRLSMLDAAAIEYVHEQSLRLLAEVGVRVPLARAQTSRMIFEASSSPIWRLDW